MNTEPKTTLLTDDANQEKMPAMNSSVQRQLVDFLTGLRRSGWAKRQGVKLGALATAAVAGWLVGNDHVDAENVTVIAAGVGAAVIALWEVVWSAIDHRATSEKIVNAMITQRPETKIDAMAQLRHIAKPDHK